MEIILLIAIILIVLYLIISRYFRRHNRATERTLRPIREWIILAQSVTPSEKDVMCFSLILQAGLILDKLNVIEHSEFRKIVTIQGFNNTNFVYMVFNSALTVLPDSWLQEMATPDNQVRVFFAQCLIGITEKGVSGHTGVELIKIIAEESRRDVLEWEIPVF